MNRTTYAAVAATALVGSVTGAAGAHAVDAVSATATGARVGIVAPAALAEAAPLLYLRMNDDSAEQGDPLSWLTNSGLAPVQAVVVTSDGGEAVRVSRNDGSWAARLPAYRDRATPPRAVIRVQGTGAADPFNPQRRDFRFGAAWNLDQVSQGSDADNGNNLVQRGLHGDAAQFKLQIDNRVPVCTVLGDEGVVAAAADPVQAQQWYRARCVREGNEVTIRVWELTADGSVEVESTTSRGAIGSVSFDARVPLSVGGKLDASGELVSSGDQFNGMVDNVLYDSAG